MKPAPPVMKIRLLLRDTAASLVVEEIAQERVERLRVVEIRNVAGVRDHLEACVRELLCERARELQVDAIALAAQDEGRHGRYPFELEGGGRPHRAARCAGVDVADL